MKFSTQRWIITGANGYVGGELCERIHRLGDTVFGVTRSGRPLRHLDEIGISCCTYEDMPSILSAGDIIVHCAGKVGNSGAWDEFLKVNRDWAASLFDQAAEHGVTCFIYVSSVAALGYRNRRGEETLDESSPPYHVEGELYGRSKWLAEQILQGRPGRNSTRLVILRPGLIYGHRHFAIAQTWLRRGVVVDMRQRVPLVHIASFTEAVARVGEHPEAQGVFLVVDEQPTLHELNTLKMRYDILRYTPWHIGKAGFWLTRLSQTVYRALCGRTETLAVRYALAEYYFHTRHLRYSTRKLRAQVGWMPAVGLKEAIEEYRRGY